MSVLEAIVLGIVQGLTEFLPISSTGHLRIVPAFLGWEDPGAAFTAVTQLGTMAAVLLYFREDLWRIATTWTRSLRRPELRSELDARMGWYIGLGTIPIAIFGFAFQDQIEDSARSLFLLSVPAVVLSGLFELRKIGGEGDAGFVPTAIATLLAFIVGYASIAFLLRWLTSHSTAVFVAYRVALGALVIALTAAGAIS